MAKKNYTEEDLFFAASSAFKAFLLTGKRTEVEVAIFLEEFLAPENSDQLSIHCLCNSEAGIEIDLKFCGKKNEHIKWLFCEICRSVDRDKRFPNVAYGVYECVYSNGESLDWQIP